MYGCKGFRNVNKIPKKCFLITKTGPNQFGRLASEVLMSKCSFINTYIILLLFECEYKTNFFIGKIRRLKSLLAFDAYLRNTLVAFQLGRGERLR